MAALRSLRRGNRFPGHRVDGPPGAHGTAAAVSTTVQIGGEVVPDESPGFYFNVEKWRGSRAVGRMSFSERGVYLEMLIEQWLRKSIPDDANAVAEAIALSDAEAAAVLEAWPVVRRKFVTSNHSPGQVYNIELENTRRKQRANFRKKQVAGSIAGKASAAKRRTKHDLPVNDRSTVVQQSLTVVDRSDQSRADQIREEAATPPVVDARSKRPMYKSDRFVVFEWMFEDLGRMLGAHLDAFDLHQFFDSLSKQSRDQGLVIPKQQVWPWLQAQVLGEAKRRGLPIINGVTVPSRPANCRHTPACVDDVAHTSRYLREQAAS